MNSKTNASATNAANGSTATPKDSPFAEAQPYIQAFDQAATVARTNIDNGFAALGSIIHASNPQEAVTTQVEYFRSATENSVEAMHQFGVSLTEANKKVMQNCFAKMDGKSNPFASWVENAYGQAMSNLDTFTSRGR